MTEQLGKLTPITDLREIWKLETDFSDWLSEEENIKTLSDEIGITITDCERESSVGDFRVDLFATEERSGKKIVIESQLADTDHDHLGKIITYASGKEAEFVIWIVKRVRDEHRRAVEWLNQRTDEKIGFFLVEIELYKIGDSLPAPFFNVVAKPNDWVKEMKTAEGTSEAKLFQLDFWQAFNEYAFDKPEDKPEFASNFNRRKAGAYNFYDLSVGSSGYHLYLNVSIQKNRIGVGVYFENNKDLYKMVFAKKEDITQFLDCHLDWKEAKKDCRILTLHDADIRKDPLTWDSLFDWYCKTALLFKQMIKKFEFDNLT